MAADLLPEVVVELLEARLLVVEALDVDAVEVGRVPGAEVLDVLSGEVDAGGELAFVFLLGRLDEGRGVLLDRGELLGGQLARQEAGRGLVLHIERVFLVMND